MIKDIFIDGEAICLRPACMKDAGGDWYAWFNDPVVTKYQNKGIFPNTKTKQKKYLKKMLMSENDLVFAIIEKRSQKHIGSVGLHNIDWVHRSAEIGIVIGVKSSWGQGYGKQAWSLATDYGFNVLNLNRIGAVILKDNIPSLRAARALGFRTEGELRNYFFKNGAYRSALILAALRGEFKPCLDVRMGRNGKKTAMKERVGP